MEVSRPERLNFLADIGQRRVHLPPQPIVQRQFGLIFQLSCANRYRDVLRTSSCCAEP